MKPFPSFMAPPSPHLLDSVATAFIQDTRWTFEQDKLFEQALALLSDVDREEDSDDGRWRKVAAMVPGKSTAEVKQHYLLLLEDLASIEAGRIALPNYYSCASPQTTTNTTSSTWEDKLIKKPGGAGGAAAAAAVCHYGAKAAKPSEQERKKGIPWTEDEHRLFLLGLDKFGKGDWRSISRNFVVSRTPTQVASHAQKYFIRLNSINKDKRRSSIHDITTAAAAAAAAPSSSSAADSSCQRPSSSLVLAAAAPPPPPSPPILLQTFAQPPPSLSRPPLYIPPLAIAAAPLQVSSPPPYAPPRPQPHPPQFSSLMSGSVSPSRLAFSPHHHSAMHHQ